MDSIVVNSVIYLLSYVRETRNAERDPRNLERRQRVARILMQEFGSSSNTLLLCAADAARRCPDLREKLARALFDFATEVKDEELSFLVNYVSICVAGEVPEFVYEEPSSYRFFSPTMVTPLTLIDRTLSMLTRHQSVEFSKIRDLSNSNPIKKKFHDAHSAITLNWFPQETPEEGVMQHLSPFDFYS
jgi:hypothetical protein